MIFASGERSASATSAVCAQSGAAQMIAPDLSAANRIGARYFESVGPDPGGQSPTGLTTTP